ncbi:MAG: hypothetical protein ABI693_31630 [Bryobacteraceae bacterium]
MPRKSMLAACFCLLCTPLCVFAADASKAETPETIAWLQYVASQLLELRRDIANDRVERQEARVQALERECTQARLERDSGEEIQRTQAQEVVQMDQRLADPSLPAEEREQLQATRTAASSTDQSYRTALARKVTELGDSLRREQTRLASLRATLQAFASSPTGGRN